MPIYLKYVFAIIVCLGIGFLGSVYTISEIPTWYASLNKPSFIPPNWIFGPVWTTLYILMGISVVKAYEAFPKKKKNFALVVFGIQLFLNFLWSVVFFTGHQLELSIIIILALWLNILYLIILFKKYSVISSVLLILYLGWVSFASVLNISVALLN